MPCTTEGWRFSMLMEWRGGPSAGAAGHHLPTLRCRLPPLPLLPLLAPLRSRSAPSVMRVRGGTARVSPHCVPPSLPSRSSSSSLGACAAVAGGGPPAACVGTDLLFDDCATNVLTRLALRAVPGLALTVTMIGDVLLDGGGRRVGVLVRHSLRSVLRARCGISILGGGGGGDAGTTGRATDVAMLRRPTAGPRQVDERAGAT